MCSSVFGVLEQRGKTIEEKGKGVHFHAAVFSDDKDFIRNVTNTFKNFVGNTLHVRVAHCDSSQLPNIMKYMQGSKSEEKLAAVAITEMWRHDKNIPKTLEKNWSYNVHQDASQTSSNGSTSAGS